MPRRSDDYHGGGGWRFSWRPDRMQRLHELGQEFDLTEDAGVQSVTNETVSQEGVQSDHPVDRAPDQSTPAPASPDYS